MGRTITVEGKTWTADWPTEPGWYWFYGWAWGYIADHSPKLHAVNAVWSNRAEASGDVMRLIDGNFMWKSEGHLGIFTRMDDITLPAWGDVEEMAVKSG